MKPEQMAHVLRATNDANAALVSALAVWDHHRVGSLLDRKRMRSIVAALSRQSGRLKVALDAALKVNSG